MANIRILTGFAVIENSGAKNITYSYNEVNQEGLIVQSNVNKSYIVLDQEEAELIVKLQEKVKLKMNS